MERARHRGAGRDTPRRGALDRSLTLAVLIADGACYAGVTPLPISGLSSRRTAPRILTGDRRVGLLFSNAGTLSQILALLATVRLVMPGSLPCSTADTGGIPGGLHDRADNHSCCPGVGDAEPPPKPTKEHRPSEGGAPCDCPPGCPAPCGCGKLPCPPMERIDSVPGRGPVGLLTHIASLHPTGVPPDRLFHPPRA